MPTKKQRLKELKTDWAFAEIVISYNTVIVNKTIITSAEDAYKVIQSLWNKDLINLQEQFMAYYLNRANQLIGYRLLTTGSMHSTSVDIRLLVSLALHCMASNVIIAHNHPSNNLQASKADEQITLQTRDALKLIDVKLLDHLIISENGYLSLREEGAI